MPKRRPVRYANAASVRRRLIFDDEPSDNSVTFSVGKCAPEPNGLPSVQPSKLSLPNTGEAECEEFRDLLWSNPVMTERPEIRERHSDPDDRGGFSRIRPSRPKEDDGAIGLTTVLGYLVFTLCILFIVLSFVFDLHTVFKDVQIERDADNEAYLLYRHRRFISLFGLLSTVCMALVLSVSCCAFSWIVIYFDSLKPGRIPPTPLSPSKYRERSGHTFHLSYVMSLVLGMMVFCYYLWLSVDDYIAT